jgi:hypothetical protein
MSVPKRHHYLPQFYLKGFCRGDHLWVYDRKENTVRKQTPANTAIQTNYYTLEDEDGNRNTAIELMLAEIEGEAKPVIDKAALRQGLSDDDKQILSVFLAFLMNRVPDFEKSVNHMEASVLDRLNDIIFQDEEHAARAIAQYEGDTGQTIDMTPQQLVDFNKSKAYTIHIHRNESLRMMLEMSMKMAKWFWLMDWMLAHAPNETSFVTSDNPLILAAPEDYKPGFWGVGLLTRGARKVVALTQQVCLVMCDRGDKIAHIDISRDDVRKVNLGITLRTDRFLIGRDHDLVKNLAARARLSEWERKGRIRIG